MAPRCKVRRFGATWRSTASSRSLISHHPDAGSSRGPRISGIGLGLIGGIIIALLTPQLSQHWLRVPLRLQSDAAFVLYLSAVGFALNMCLTVFGAIPQGLQRLDLFAMRSLVLTTVTGVAQIT